MFRLELFLEQTPCFVYVNVEWSLYFKTEDIWSYIGGDLKFEGAVM